MGKGERNVGEFENSIASGAGEIRGTKGGGNVSPGLLFQDFPPSVQLRCAAEAYPESHTDRAWVRRNTVLFHHRVLSCGLRGSPLRSRYKSRSEMTQACPTRNQD
eukprot:488936-Rhodomonas_salina.3